MRLPYATEWLVPIDVGTISSDLGAVSLVLDYDNTIITVSHDRHFLNKVCTHMVDIDYYQAKLYPGNYDFWLESSELMNRLMAQKNKKKEE